MIYSATAFPIVSAGTAIFRSVSIILMYCNFCLEVFNPQNHFDGISDRVLMTKTALLKRGDSIKSKRRDSVVKIRKPTQSPRSNCLCLGPINGSLLSSVRSRRVLLVFRSEYDTRSVHTLWLPFQYLM